MWRTGHTGWTARSLLTAGSIPSICYRHKGVVILYCDGRTVIGDIRKYRKQNKSDRWSIISNPGFIRFTTKRQSKHLHNKPTTTTKQKTFYAQHSFPRYRTVVNLPRINKMYPRSRLRMCANRFCVRATTNGNRYCQVCCCRRNRDEMHAPAGNHHMCCESRGCQNRISHFCNSYCRFHCTVLGHHWTSIHPCKNMYTLLSTACGNNGSVQNRSSLTHVRHLMSGNGCVDNCEKNIEEWLFWLVSSKPDGYPRRMRGTKY